MAKMRKSDYIWTFTFALFVCIINMTMVSYGATDIEDEGNYFVDYRYLPKYSLDSNKSNYTNLDVVYSGNNSYIEPWSHSKTYSIEGSGAVNLYTMIDSYDNNKFSIRCRVDDDTDIYLFKLQNMYVFYEYQPKHIIPEKLQIQGSVTTYIPDSWLEEGYTDVQLQARSRSTGEWVTLKTYQVHYGEVYPLYYYLEQGSINYDSYRIYFNYWNIKFNGYTVAFAGASDPPTDSYDICACDFYNTSEDNTEELLEDLKELQQNTISSIDSVGDLIKALPDMLLDGIYDLFVPAELGDTFSDYIDELLDKLGILGFPFQVIKYELEEITDYNPDSNIPIPDIQVMGQSFLQDYTFDMDSVGQINVDIINIKLITVVRMITAYLFAMALIVRVKVLLYDFGILKSPDDDIGGDV